MSDILLFVYTETSEKLDDLLDWEAQRLFSLYTALANRKLRQMQNFNSDESVPAADDKYSTKLWQNGNKRFYRFNFRDLPDNWGQV